MNEEFNVGDTVTILLENGEQRYMAIIQYPASDVLGMVVNKGSETINNIQVRLNPQRAKCEWFDAEGNRHENTYPVTSLTKVGNCV